MTNQLSFIPDAPAVIEPAYALFSGGKDSFATACVLEDAGMLRGCVALRTGISTPDWQVGVERICAARQWPLEFFDTSASYEQLVRQYGFPGPAQHGMFMNYLKGRAIRKFKKAHPGATLASGVRSAESGRRSLSAKAISDFEGVRVIAPILNWTTDEVWEYVRSRDYERPFAYSAIQISGDCLCGAFAHEGERDAIRFWYPEIDQRLCALESEGKRGCWGWGNDQPKLKTGAASLICVECGQTEMSF